MRDHVSITAVVGPLIRNILLQLRLFMNPRAISVIPLNSTRNHRLSGVARSVDLWRLGGSTKAITDRAVVEFHTFLIQRLNLSWSKRLRSPYFNHRTRSHRHHGYFARSLLPKQLGRDDDYDGGGDENEKPQRLQGGQECQGRHRYVRPADERRSQTEGAKSQP